MQATTTLIGDISIGHICQLDLMISTHVALPPLPDVPRHCGMKAHHENALTAILDASVRNNVDTFV